MVDRIPTHLKSLRAFLAPFLVIHPDDAIIERFAPIRSSLRRQGRLISDFDIPAAATALHHDHAMLTFNTRHFSRIQGLTLHPIT